MSGGRGWGRIVALVVVLVVLGADLAVVGIRKGEPGESALRAIERTAVTGATSTPDPVATPSTTTTTAAAESTAPITSAPVTSAPVASVPVAPVTATTQPVPARPLAAASAGVAEARPGAWTLGPHQGVGVWLDVYDWTNELTGGQPSVQLADVDRMAELGIQTLYIQTAHRRSAADVIEPDRLLPLIDRAHERGIAVVAWYLPTFEDVSADLRRLLAAVRLPVDGLGVDIESRAVADPTERNRRLLELSTRLRQAVGQRAVAAITPSAVHLQVINPSFWPGFPWAELAGAYDAFLPMSYWSIRRPEWRSGERYIGENIDRIRASTGRPDVPIHPIGGIADGASVADVQGMVRAIRARGVLGGSLYDWNTSNAAQWDALRPLRVG